MSWQSHLLTPIDGHSGGATAKFAEQDIGEALEQRDRMVRQQFSVVIPVYNAESYVDAAVQSALQQPETGEVLLVEDGSSDQSWNACQKVAKASPRIKLLRHAGGRNLGPSATRNLGIRSASCNYIAFLDADDYYLPGRFKQTVEVIRRNGNADGVYEAVGSVFETEEDRAAFEKTPLREVVTINTVIDPDALFEHLMSLRARFGSTHLDGLCARKDLLVRVGLFNEHLRLHQDTELFWKLIALGRMYPGNLQSPVAVWRGHGGNRITDHLADQRRHYETSLMMWSWLQAWGREHLTPDRQHLIALRYLAYMRKADYFNDWGLQDFFESRRKMLQVVKENMPLVLDAWFWRLVLPSRSVFGQKR